MIQLLPSFEEKFNVDLKLNVVAAPEHSAAPQREMLKSWC
jgi:hypothetical protein